MIRLEVTRIDQCLQFVVRNQGVGIPADERAHVFELFFRGSNAKGERGMGLGLSIVAQAGKPTVGKSKCKANLVSARCSPFPCRFSRPAQNGMKITLEALHFGDKIEENQHIYRESQ